MLKKDRLKRKRRIRAKLFGIKSMPRLSVFRSSRFIYAQIIDDEKAVTLASFSDRSLPDSGKLTKTEKAALVGRDLAARALKLKIKRVVFDRGGYKYHGRVKAIAEGAREGGLQI